MKAVIKFNRKAIEDKVFAVKRLQLEASRILGEKIQQEKNRFLLAYDEHRITRELLAGPSAENTSGAITGEGNLFTFIGFEAGKENPTISLRKFLESSISISPKFMRREGKKFLFRVSVPSKEEIEGKTPLPYESGRSWIHGIEHGISGIGFYFYSRKHQKINGSRSGLGIQSQNRVSGGMSFNNQTYFSKMLQDFYKTLKIK